MGKIENLSQDEALQKLKSLAEHKSCHFCTYDDSQTIDARPMFTQSVEAGGVFWFFSHRNSNKNRQIDKDKRVELLFSDTSHDSHLFVKGESAVLRDQAVVDRLWSPFAKTWFPDGKDDQSLTLIRVRPLNAHYWDATHGKMISNLAILFSAITGAQIDDGREGDLHVKAANGARKDRGK